MRIVTLLSGGLDSTTLLYHLFDAYGDRLDGLEVVALSFDYGQRHRKELRVAEDIATAMGIEHHVIDIGIVGGSRQPGGLVYRHMRGEKMHLPISMILPGSSLTDSSVPVPDGHYAEESMKQTIVPNRNAIMLSIAYGVAVARGAELVAFAAHSGDHAIYPDCRPEFIIRLDAALKNGNSWADPIPSIMGPFRNMTKAEIARRAFDLGVPIEKTWSCYKGGDIHCGTCGTCYERREAFEVAGVNDPTQYLDSTTRFSTPSPTR